MSGRLPDWQSSTPSDKEKPNTPGSPKPTTPDKPTTPSTPSPNSRPSPRPFGSTPPGQSPALPPTKPVPSSPRLAPTPSDKQPPARPLQPKSPTGPRAAPGPSPKPGASAAGLGGESSSPRSKGTLASPSAGKSGKLPGWHQPAKSARPQIPKKGEIKQAGKAAAKKAAGKAASSAASAATGVPQPVIEKIARHWRGLAAALLLVPSFFIFFLFLIASGTFGGGSIASASCTSAALAATSSPTIIPGTPPPPAQLSLFLAAERWAESRNNYSDATANATWEPGYTGGTLKNGYSGAFGAYQYIQSTWYSYATSAGEATYAKDNPATLPPAVSDTVQDAVANWEFSRDYKQDESNPVDTGNIWMWVAEQHFDSTYAIPADQNVAPGNNNGETMADYGNAVVGYMSAEPWLAAPSASTTTTNAVLAGYSGSCNATELSGPLASQIVELAQSEAKAGLTQAEGNAAYGADAWGPNGQEWCSYFASWVLDQAGVTPPPGSLGYVGDLWNWGATSGGTQLPPSATPAPGDLVIFGTGYANHGMAHVAIVTSVLPDGDITVVGGNEVTNSATTSSVSQSSPFNPATAASNGWPDPIYGYVQPPGA